VLQHLILKTNLVDSKSVRLILVSVNLQDCMSGMQ